MAIKNIKISDVIINNSQCDHPENKQGTTSNERKNHT